MGGAKNGEEEAAELVKELRGLILASHIRNANPNLVREKKGRNTKRREEAAGERWEEGRRGNNNNWFG